MIYIAKAVLEEFDKEPNKSGLVNDLLLDHYDKKSSSQTKRHYPERFENHKKTKKPEPEQSVTYKNTSNWGA